MNDPVDRVWRDYRATELLDGRVLDKTASALLSGRKALNGWLYIGSDALVFIGQFGAEHGAGLAAG